MLLALTLLTASAHAWEVLHSEAGEELRFTEMPVSFTFDESNAPSDINIGQQRAAVRKSFGAWSNVESSVLEFKEDGPDANPVFWENDWDYDDNLLAITSTWATNSGTIVGFEVRINGEYSDWGLGNGNSMDLQNTITHEVGHAIGLGHEAEIHEATMFPTAIIGELSKREIDEDDVEAVQFLYGNGVPTKKKLFACNAMAGGASAFWAAPALAALFIRRRKV